MASYLIGLFNGDKCELALCSGENADINLATKNIKANISIFFNRDHYQDHLCELRIYPIMDAPSIYEQVIWAAPLKGVKK
jgi:hypothetical protein